jgi:hypothetical protein
MKRILIGSCRLKELYPEFNRTPKDVDFAVDVDKKSDIPRVEYLYNPILCDWVGDGEVDGDTLLTLKVSHLFWDNNWEKHLWDCHFILDKGHKIHYDLLDKLIEFWTDYLPKIRRSDLAMTKESFFTNAVNEDTDQHDYLHTLLNPVPMFTKLLKDGSEVELDPSKWETLSFEEKKAVVFEETAVMAFERYPNLYYKKAFIRQLKDNIIKHFPFYIALFAIINYRQLYNPSINFIKTIQENGLKKD